MRWPMTRLKTQRLPWRKVVGSVVVLAAATHLPSARALDIRPSVRLGTVYTTNLALTPNDEVDDFVMRVDPSVAVTHKSQRIDFRADYTYSYLRYQDAAEQDASFSEGAANLDLTLIPDAFYLESFAERSQQLINPESVVWWTNVPIVDNRTNENRIETSPRLKTEIRGVDIDSRYVTGRVSYPSSDLQSVNYQETHTAITGPARGKGLSWGLFHDYEVYEYETPPDSKLQLAYLTLTYGFRSAGDFFVFGSAGKESDYRDFTSASLDEPYWEIGGRHVGGRLLVEAAFGDRSYGKTFRGRIRQELNAGSIELLYSEVPAVQEGLFQARSKDPVAPQPPQVPPSTLDPGLGQRFVYKVASATLLKELGRNQLTAAAIYYQQDDILERCVPGPGCNDPAPADVQQNSEDQLSFTLGLTRQIGRRTSAGLEGQIARRDFADGTDDQVNALRLVGNYAFGRKLGLEGYVARYQQQGSDDLENNYVEIQVGLSVNYDFR